MADSAPTRNTLEIEVRHFDGAKCAVTLRWFLASRLLADPTTQELYPVHIEDPGSAVGDLEPAQPLENPGSRTGRGIDTTLTSPSGTSRVDLTQTLRAMTGEALLKLLALTTGTAASDWPSITDVRVHIHRSARALQALPWEALAEFIATADQPVRAINRRVYRFEPSPTDPRPRYRRAPPASLVLALKTLFDDAGFAISVSSFEALHYRDSSLHGIEKALKAAVNTSASSLDTQGAEDAILVLRTTISHEKEYLLRFAPSQSADGPTYPPDAFLLPTVAATLGRLKEKAPRILVLINEPDNRSVQLAGAAHELVEAGIPAVILLPKIHDPTLLQNLIDALWINISTVNLPSDDLQSCVWAALPKDLQEPHLRPIIVGNTRSGIFWHHARGPEKIEEIRQMFQDTKRKKTAVLGPLWPGGMYEWLRAPIEALFVRTNAPFHPEDRGRFGLLGSYLLASVAGRRECLQTLWYLSWVDAIASLISIANANTPAERLVHGLRSKPGASIFLDPMADYSRDQEVPLVRPAMGAWVNARDPMALWNYAKEATSSLAILRDNAETILKSVLDLWLPSSSVAPSLRNSAYGKLAALDVDLYVTLDPMPLLEYALAQKGKIVRYTIWPSFKDTGRWWTSPLSAGKHGKEVHLIYLAGAVHDPSTLLLTDHEILAKLPPEPAPWNTILQEVGHSLGPDSLTLFLGFEPQDLLFQQLLIALFPTNVSRSHERLLIALRPGDDAFAYPEQAAFYLESFLSQHLRAIHARLDGMAQPGTSARREESDSLQLYWGSPLQLVDQLLKKANQ